MQRIVNTTYVRDVAGKILGIIEEDDEGNQRCRAFSGQVLGYYDKKANVTRAFNGRIITRGNSCIGFLYKK